MAVGVRTLEPDTRDAQSRPAPEAPAPAPDAMAILALQRGAGNAAVARALLARDPTTATHPDLSRPHEGPDVELLQRCGSSSRARTAATAPEHATRPSPA